MLKGCFKTTICLLSGEKKASKSFFFFPMAYLSSLLLEDSEWNVYHEFSFLMMESKAREQLPLSTEARN